MGGDGGGGYVTMNVSLQDLDDAETPIEIIRARSSPAQMKEVRSIYALLSGDDGYIGPDNLMEAMVDVGTDPSESEVSDLILYASEENEFDSESPTPTVRSSMMTYDRRTIDTSELRLRMEVVVYVVYTSVIWIPGSSRATSPTVKLLSGRPSAFMVPSWSTRTEMARAVSGSTSSRSFSR